MPRSDVERGGDVDGAVASYEDVPAHRALSGLWQLADAGGEAIGPYCPHRVCCMPYERERRGYVKVVNTLGRRCKVQYRKRTFDCQPVIFINAKSRVAWGFALFYPVLTDGSRIFVQTGRIIVQTGDNLHKNSPCLLAHCVTSPPSTSAAPSSLPPAPPSAMGEAGSHPRATP